MAACVLVTGFDPFAAQPVNPSWQAAHALHGSIILGHPVVAAQIPTVFGACAQALRDSLRRHRPTLVICTGYAGKRTCISLERVAVNVDDAPIPDNAGAQPVDSPVVPGGPAAYFTGLPVKAMLQDLLEAGVDAEVSQTAGTFVCNHLFYALMHELATESQWRGVRGGFIHVPNGMPLEDIVEGLRLAIACALRTRDDAAVQAGALS